ncbi:hypothetical protein quinque_015040 [Culex quinquefasciatus]
MPPNTRSTENLYIDDDLHQVDRAHFLDEFYHSIYPEPTIYDTKENPREGSKRDPETTPWWSGTCWLRRSPGQPLYGWFRRKFWKLMRC